MLASGASGSAPPFVIISHPREPGFLTDGVDVEDWLKMYERVSGHNRWDPTLMLANIGYYLRGTPQVWYETTEHDLTSWDDCKSRLKELFGQPEGRQLAAKKELATRAQTTTESYVSYIQDVLSLCMKADAQMTEADKVGHVLKGIADDAFHLLLCKDCTTVSAIIKECQKFEQAKSRRITAPFTRLPNTAPTSSCEDPVPSRRQSPSDVGRDAPEGLTRVIRRELEAMAPASLFQHASQSSHPSIPLIQAVVRQEIENLGIRSVCAVDHPGRHETPFRTASRNTYRTSNYRNPAEWRTRDDRPICFNCHRAGHVARYCQSRPLRPTRRPYPDFQYANDAPRSFSPRRQPHDAARISPSRIDRSPSPQRRQSRSPPFRRSSSPTPYATSPEN